MLQEFMNLKYMVREHQHQHQHRHQHQH
ncbi:MAG: hypothetical protein ACD_84C00007G0001, partial [uncultured bacterium]